MVTKKGYIILVCSMPKVSKENNPYIIALASRIKELRIAMGYTSYEYFAYEKGFSRSQYGRYEKGEDIRYSSLMKLISAFELTPNEFFDDRFSQLSVPVTFI